MDVSVDIDALRRKHKTELVERALRIYHPEIGSQEVRDYWLEQLLNGYDFKKMLACLKNGHATPVANPSAANVNIPQDDPVGTIKVADENLEILAGLKRKLRVKLSNSSNRVYRTTPEEPVFVSYHWYSGNGEVYEFDGVRTPLPEPVEPGHEIELMINLTPPAEPGDYELMVTMVHEGRHWMEDIGLAVERRKCVVQDYDGRGLTRHALSVFKQLEATGSEFVR